MPPAGIRSVATFGLEAAAKQLVEEWGISVCHAKRLHACGSGQNSERPQCLVLPNAWVQLGGMCTQSAPRLAHEYRDDAIRLGLPVVGWAAFAAQCKQGAQGEASSSSSVALAAGSVLVDRALLVGSKRPLDKASVKSSKKQAVELATAAAASAGKSAQEVQRAATKAAKRVEAKAAFEVGKLAGNPASVAQELRIRAFTERVALYLSCAGRVADTEDIAKQVLRWSTGVDMIPGKLKMILWARTDRFDCGGRQFRSSGGVVRLKGTVSAAAVATAEADAVAATAAAKPSKSGWLERRALYNMTSPDRAATAAVAALRAVGFDPSAGLPQRATGAALADQVQAAAGGGAPTPTAPVDEAVASSRDG